MFKLVIDKLIDFNGMSNCLGFSYTKMLRNSILFKFMFTFLCNCFENSYTKYFYQIEIINTQLYGFKYSYQKQIILWFQSIILI